LHGPPSDDRLTAVTTFVSIMVFFMIITAPAMVAARVALNVLIDQAFRVNVGQALADGSVVRALAHVTVSKRSDGWRKCPKQIRALAGARNGLQICKEKVVGKDRRIFVALQVPSGEVLLLLLNKHEVSKDVLEDNKSIKKSVDTNLAKGWRMEAVTLDGTMITEVEPTMFRIAPDYARTFGARNHFDLLIESSPQTKEEAAVTEGQCAALEWLRHHCLDADMSAKYVPPNQDNCRWTQVDFGPPCTVNAIKPLVTGVA